MSPDFTTDMPAIILTSKASVQSILTRTLEMPSRLMTGALNTSWPTGLIFSFCGKFRDSTEKLAINSFSPKLYNYCTHLFSSNFQ
jgi:hypothetical protein